MTTKKTKKAPFQRSAGVLLVAKETHDHDVRVKISVEGRTAEVLVPRKVAFMAAVELLLACSVVGKQDVKRYFG